MSVSTEKSTGQSKAQPPTPAQAYALCQWVDALTPANIGTSEQPAGWNVHWIPESDALNQENFAVLLQNKADPLQFALVIQGSADLLDAFDDFCVEFQGPFDPIAGGEVAVGALAALYNLLSLHNEPTVGNTSTPGTDLAKYIQDTLTLQNYGSLFITGRNLGGTLASLIAPWIAYQIVNKQVPYQPSDSLPSNISVMAFGPFAPWDSLVEQFLSGSSTYSAWINTNDAVPYAWAATGQYSLANICVSWRPTVKMPAIVWVGLEAKLMAMEQNQVSYSQISKPNVFTTPVVAPPSGGNELQNFEWELEYQQNYAYCQKFLSTAGDCSMPQLGDAQRELKYQQNNAYRQNVLASRGAGSADQPVANAGLNDTQAYILCNWMDGLTPSTLSSQPPQYQSQGYPQWNVIWMPAASIYGQANYAALLVNTTNALQFALVLQGTHDALDVFQDLCSEFQDSFVPVQGASVAVGGLAALYNVLGLQNLGMDLASALQNMIPWEQNPTLLVTGHSLGGTLASLIAPWIAYQFLNEQEQYQPTDVLPSQLQVFAFAPFAPWSAALEQFLSGSQNYTAWMNTNDAVPYVWQTAESGQFYVGAMASNLWPGVPMPGDVSDLLSIKTGAMAKNNVSYVQITNPQTFICPVASPPAGSADAQWGWELSYQHNYAYCQNFLGPLGVTCLQPLPGTGLFDLP